MKAPGRQAGRDADEALTLPGQDTRLTGPACPTRPGVGL